MQQNLEALSHENILVALLVLLVLIWVAKQIMDFVITMRTFRKPQEKAEHDLTSHQAACEKKFASDKDRLDKLESRMDSVEEGQRVLLNGVYEIIGHLLHNGNMVEMEKANKAIFDFLNS